MGTVHLRLDQGLGMFYEVTGVPAGITSRTAEVKNAFVYGLNPQP